MLFSLLSTVCLAATWTPEDLVRANARGLPTETVARMAESVVIDADTAVYLLRRGVAPELVRAWGHPVSEAEGMTALRLGAADAPTGGVSDVDWREMAELPSAIARDGADVAGTVVTVVPRLAVVDTREARVVVQRAEARDVWVDARPLDRAVADELGLDPGERSGPSPQLARLRGGRTAVGVGALLGVFGGIGFLAGAGVVGPAPNVSGADYWQGSGVHGETNPVLMAVGAVGLLAGGLTVHFGARDVRLAGAYAEAPRSVLARIDRRD